ncbi:hypothetical protein CMI42_01835 [Candidatus Pacearchaeota archaeon]|nr:hypothetical protein [Candidatus Pacearchaeota archaeon]|tara:strand:- start:1837 stop:2709 length:873 start_codon:yes stop_codon:yes gene_type:complete
MAVDKDLINDLDDISMIDKKVVLWWQLGYEGRRIYQEGEFNNSLKEVNYDCISSMTERAYKGEEPINRKFDIWPEDNVPILIREAILDECKVPCFVSVKPMSHGNGDGWRELNARKSSKFPLSIYYSPHIRGVVLDKTDEFLFWTPLLFGRENVYYQSIAYKSKDEDMTCLVNPISPDKFYKNLITGGWSGGMRSQKKAIEFDYKKEGFEVVPYYDFDFRKNQIMIYPSQIFEGKLDLPIVIRGDEKGPEILGVGYCNPLNKIDAICYWELDLGVKRRVKKTLIERLGRI